MFPLTPFVKLIKYIVFRMKKFGMMAMAALAMVACQQEKNAYIISGSIEAAGEGDSVSLQLVEGRNRIDLEKVPV